MTRKILTLATILILTITLVSVAFAQKDEAKDQVARKQIAELAGGVKDLAGGLKLEAQKRRALEKSIAELVENKIAALERRVTDNALMMQTLLCRHFAAAIAKDSTLFSETQFTADVKAMGAEKWVAKYVLPNAKYKELSQKYARVTRAFRGKEIVRKKWLGQAFTVLSAPTVASDLEAKVKKNSEEISELDADVAALYEDKREKNYASEGDMNDLRNELLDKIPTAGKTLDALHEAGYRTKAELEMELKDVFAGKKYVESVDEALSKAERSIKTTKTTAEKAKSTAERAFNLGQANGQAIAPELANDDRKQFIKYCFQLARYRITLQQVGIELEDVLKNGVLRRKQTKEAFIEELTQGFQAIDAVLSFQDAKSMAQRVCAGPK